MAHLPTRSFQAYQVFAANTNVGKTILSTGLVRAAASLSIGADKQRKKAFYLKPVQTGYPVDCDARHVKTFAPLVETSRLYAYPDPVSPHIATTEPPPDSEVLQATINEIRKFKNSLTPGETGWALLETAGGVNSPIMSGELQSKFYRPLRLPTVLVGDSHLGGISTTLTSYESLHQYGYDIPALLLFDNKSRNHQFLEKYLAKAENRPLVHVLPSPPEKLADPLADQEQLHEYYKKTEAYFQDVVQHLEQTHQKRLDRLEELGDKARTSIWWPFTQHQTVKDVTVIDSAYGDIMTTYVEPKDKLKAEGKWKEMFDGCASWWTQGLGHGSPALTRSAAYAAGRYGHVMFPECSHEPAVKLSETLLETVGEGWASRVFFSDNGSTAIEVALKMALKASQDRYVDLGKATGKIEVLGIDGGYHGDTIGAMNACSPNLYNAQVTWYKAHGHWFTPPTVLYKDSKFQITIPSEMTGGDQPQQVVTIDNLTSVFTPPKEGDARLSIYRNHIRSTLNRLTKEENRQFGALLMEPVLMGAGGMMWVDPAFQRCLVEEVRAFDGFGKETSVKNEFLAGSKNTWKGLPVVFDEVFSGCWRLGRKSAADMLQVNPDIAAYAKLLTGGLITLATTLTSDSIFNNFLSETKTDALLHGHSYTAHPIGCAVANTSLQTYREMESHGDADQARKDWGAIGHGETNNLGVWSLWDQKVVDQISRLDVVEGVVPLGSVLAIVMKTGGADGGGYGSLMSQQVQRKLRDLREEGDETEVAIFGRPLGNVVYMIASQVSTREQLNKVENILLRTLKSS
ncbi:bifunctional dethiobiotin synthetase / adenosylmethionine---8-amino-7-oxononanoate aminotransferase [Entomortierella parvispora]|uniref:Bifunctional dethiobiotin synthetase / adenosylmethionine---8-amino-7-oxononanoate aminotransferase n=1 Tax=Entomortierella parvispora TaxID=205924 RepID=A0A9P3LSY4_9FUNG|nr:bifunctional dethiobiotin synthetase / adenosylmethionine---8-amino-7-oxononanoate aminotransferase [Entomortierella parvispora]